MHPYRTHYLHTALEFTHVKLMLLLVAYGLVDQLPVITLDVLKARALNEQEAIKTGKDTAA